MEYSGGVIGSTMVDMNLKSQAPNQYFPFLVVTGVDYEKCRENGMPTKDEMTVLYEIEDEIGQLLSSKMLAGAFTADCRRLSFFYVSDTLGIRGTLQKYYKSKRSNYSEIISIKEDKQWKEYLTFLYPPDEPVKHNNENDLGERLKELEEAGVELSKFDKAYYTLQLKREGDVVALMNRIGKLGFTKEVLYTEKSTNDQVLIISHETPITQEDMDYNLRYIKKTAKKHNGKYIEWSLNLPEN
ncbi:hypothetical protein GCM10023331_04510 [Algivirga pacifica]|uniref:Uncharacterized protein n=2 Tax=Algivirga pacifica TaxID=1162670 RepID=A0ABP9D0G1_9BACT